jgi:hypothetical protein
MNKNAIVYPVMELKSRPIGEDLDVFGRSGELKMGSNSLASSKETPNFATWARGTSRTYPLNRAALAVKCRVWNSHY